MTELAMNLIEQTRVRQCWTTMHYVGVATGVALIVVGWAM